MEQSRVMASSQHIAVVVSSRRKPSQGVNTAERDGLVVSQDRGRLLVGRHRSWWCRG